tara:strand:- start:1815 stop:2012 length:198 start_codon:yes stop_codon:yes gene_type:complete
MRILTDEINDHKLMLLIDVNGKVIDYFLSKNEEKIEEWKEKNKAKNGLFSLHSMGRLIELMPIKK